MKIYFYSLTFYNLRSSLVMLSNISNFKDYITIQQLVCRTLIVNFQRINKLYVGFGYFSRLTLFQKAKAVQ